MSLSFLWSNLFIHAACFLPLIILVVYLVVGLRRVNHENQKMIAAYEQQAAALQHANEELQRSNMELRRFSYVASHDLQTPMRNIVSFAGLLQSGYVDRLDEQAQHWLGCIVQSTERLQQLITHVFDYSMLSIIEHPFERIDMHDVVNDARLLLKPVIEDVGGQITCEGLPAVSGDQSQLVQLMMNLLSNAIKFRNESPPRIHIEACRQEREWLFSVHDNGIGIDPKHHERIFEMFQRLNPPQKYPGIGMGLAICRSIAQHHGGRLWVHSLEGLGSIFCFTLPCITGSD